MADKNCAKCGRRMEEGFTIDAGHYNAPTVGVWHRGKPNKGIFGLKAAKIDKIEIVSWRCTACGFLESYAP